MRGDYARLAELSNQGARELGFADTGALWRSQYDMTPDEFQAEIERLWTQVEPLYRELHTYVRRKLIEKYGDAARRPDGMIPGHFSAICGRRSGAISTTSSLRPPVPCLTIWAQF